MSMEKKQNRFNSVEELKGYFKILYDFWTVDWYDSLSKEDQKENDDAFDDALKYVDELANGDEKDAR